MSGEKLSFLDFLFLVWQTGEKLMRKKKKKKNGVVWGVSRVWKVLLFCIKTTVISPSRLFAQCWNNSLNTPRSFAVRRVFDELFIFLIAPFPLYPVKTTLTRTHMHTYTLYNTLTHTDFEEQTHWEKSLELLLFLTFLWWIINGFNGITQIWILLMLSAVPQLPGNLQPYKNAVEINSMLFCLSRKTFQT